MNDTTHRPVFKLAPAESEITQTILSARDEVVNDPLLSLGARLMFTIILDRSVRQSTNIMPGVVTISQTKLSEVLGVGRRTIWNWKDELVRRGVIWMTQQPMPNAWPIDTYHVTALHAPTRKGEKTTVEGAWGNGHRQMRPANASYFARRNTVPLAPEFQNPENSSILPDISAPRGTNVPAPAAPTFHGPEQSGATARGNVVPRGVERSFHGPEQSGATEGGTVVPRPVESSCSHIKAKEQGSSQNKGGKGSSDASSPPDLELEKFKNRLNGMFDSKLVTLEKELRGKLDLAKTPASREHWKARLAAVKAHRLGGLPPDEKSTVKPVRTQTGTNAPKPMPLDQRQKLWSAAKEKLSPQPVAAGA